MIMLYPWIVPSRRILDYHSRENRVIVIMREPSDEFTDIMNKHADELPPRTSFIFINGNEALVYKPRHWIGPLTYSSTSSIGPTSGSHT